MSGSLWNTQEKTINIEWMNKQKFLRKKKKLKRCIYCHLAEADVPVYWYLTVNFPVSENLFCDIGSLRFKELKWK